MNRVLRDGWDALAAADWPAARAVFEGALGEGETGEALDGLSQALHFQREPVLERALVSKRMPATIM